MGNDYDPQPYAPPGNRQPTTPWRTIIAAVSLLWAISAWIGGMVISGVRDLDKRVFDMESKCAVVQDRLSHFDADIDELQRWRGNCGARMASVEKHDSSADTTLIRLENRIDAVVELINKRHNQ